MTYNLLLKGKFRMNLEDFFRKDPGLLDQFKKCSSKDDFMNVAQENIYAKQKRTDISSPNSKIISNKFDPTISTFNCFITKS